MLGKAFFDLIYSILVSNWYWFAAAGIVAGIVRIGIGAVKEDEGKKGMNMIKRFSLSIVALALFPALLGLTLSLIGTTQHTVNNLNYTSLSTPVPLEITPIDFGNGGTGGGTGGGGGVTIGPVSH